MKTIYVAGPVVRDYGIPDDLETEKVYEEIRRTLKAAGFEVVLPVSEESLEVAAPRDFYRKIAARIRASDLVIAVFPELNPSSGIESTMASFMNKPQYVVTHDERSTPRLLRGLPKVEGVGQVDEIKKILAEVKRRHSQEDENPPMMTMDVS